MRTGTVGDLSLPVGCARLLPRAGAAGAEAFWKLADGAVGAGGALAARYEQVRSLELAAREKARLKEQAAREEQAARRLSRGRAQSPVPVISGPAAVVVCPNCCQSFELVPRLPSGQEGG